MENWEWVADCILAGFYVAGMGIGIALERRFNFFKW